jgi:hypothetical protein
MTIAFHFIAAHVLSIVGFAMAALLAADVLRGDRAPGTTYAWLLAILFVPYLGVPLYLALGGRKLARMARSKNDLYAGTRAAGADASHLERMLCGLGAPPARAGQEIEILGTGEQAFAAVMAAIESATQTTKSRSLAAQISICVACSSTTKSRSFAAPRKTSLPSVAGSRTLPVPRSRYHRRPGLGRWLNGWPA